MSIGDFPMQRIREWGPPPAPEEPTQTAQGARASSFAPRGQPAPAGRAGGFRRAGRGLPPCEPGALVRVGVAALILSEMSLKQKLLFFRRAMAKLFAAVGWLHATW
jgi:hypothetical protein